VHLYASAIGNSGEREREREKERERERERERTHLSTGNKLTSCRKQARERSVGRPLERTDEDYEEGVRVRRAGKRERERERERERPSHGVPNASSIGSEGAGGRGGEEGLFVRDFIIRATGLG